MPNEAHGFSEEAASQAEALLREGEQRSARELYRKAAEYEVTALKEIAGDQPRTRGILGVSAVSLFYKANEFPQSEVLAHSLLANRNLPDFASDQLRELLQVLWEEQSLASIGLQYSGETLTVSLRGPSIGAGAAPVRWVIDRVDGINSLLYRITEWLTNTPLRHRGLPAQEIREICQPWMTQTQAGSFRFGVLLIEPIERRFELFERKKTTPST